MAIGSFSSAGGIAIRRLLPWLLASTLIVLAPRTSLGADLDVSFQEVTALKGGSPQSEFLPGEELQVRVRLRVLNSSGNPFDLRLRIAGDGWHEIETRRLQPGTGSRSVTFGGSGSPIFVGSGAGPGKVSLLCDVFSGQDTVSLQGTRHGYLEVYCPEGLPAGIARRFEVGITPTDMALTKDGRYLYVTSREDRRITVIDAEAKEVAAELEDPETIGMPMGVAPSANGQKMYVADAGYQALHVIDVDSPGEIEETILLNPEGELGRNSLGDVAVSPTRNEVYITDSRGSRILVLDTVSHEVGQISIVGTPTPPLGLNPAQVMLDPDPRFIYVLCSTSNEVIKLNVGTRRIVDFVQLRNPLDLSSLWPVWSMALNRTRGRIYVTANPGDVQTPIVPTKIYVLPKDDLDRRPRQEFRAGASVWDLVPWEDENGRFVYGIDSYRGEILIIDMDTRTELYRCAIPVEAGGRHLRADFERNRLFVGGWLSGFADIVE